MDFDQRAKEIVEKMDHEQKARLFLAHFSDQSENRTELGISFAVAEGMSKLHLLKNPSKQEIVGLVDTIPFPMESALASSFDPMLLEEIGEAVGEQCIEHQIDLCKVQTAKPVINPLDPERRELFSEDSILTAKLTAGFVNGLQRTGVGAIMSEGTEKVLEPVLKECEPVWLYSEDQWSEPMEKQLVKSLKNGELPVEKIDEKLTQLVETLLVIEDQKQRKIQFADKSKDFLNHSDQLSYFFNRSEHRKLAWRASEESAVLLKNNGILPIAQKNNIAVIGTLAKYPRYRVEDASLEEVEIATPLRVFQEYGYSFGYADGYRLLEDEPDEEMITEAKKVSEGREVVIVFLGTAKKESESKKHLLLPQNQMQLLDAVLSVNQNVIAVVENGHIYRLPQIDKISALLSMGYAGDQCGRACVNLLSGKANPCGKLAETMPLSVNDIPKSSDDSLYGYPYYDSHRKNVLFPFGYGLSYTTFLYGNVETDGISCDFSNDQKKVYHVDISVKNTGAYDGKEIVELYVRRCDSPVQTKELKGFTKIYIPKNEIRQASFELTKEDFATYTEEHHSYVVQSGEYEIMIGSNSRNILHSFRVTIQV